VNFWQQQTLLISLPVYIYQMRLNRFQQSDIGNLIIDKDPASSIGDEFSPDQRFTLADIYSSIGKQLLERRIALNLKDPFNESAISACSDEIRRRPISKQQAQSVYEDRFAGTGLSAQNVETPLKLYLQPINYRKIYDIQKSQHILHIGCFRNSFTSLTGKIILRHP
jgi:hypothetical protein